MAFKIHPSLAEAFGTHLSHTATLDPIELLEEAANRNPDKDAVVCLHQTPDLQTRDPSDDEASPYLRWTFRQLQEISTSLGERLLGDGLQYGSTVATLLFNQAEFLVFLWASIKFGFVLAPLNAAALGRRDEFIHYLKVTAADAMVVSDLQFTKALDEIIGSGKTKIGKRILIASKGPESGSKWDHWLPHTLLDPPPTGSTPSTDHKLDETRRVVVFFTSGTTSQPKGVDYTARAISSLVDGVKSRGVVSPYRYLSNLPTFHGFGFTATIAALIFGGTVVYASKTFDAGLTLKAIELEKCTTTIGAPTLCLALFDHPWFSKFDTGSLQCMDLGGTMISPHILQALRDKFTGMQLAAALYGITDAGYITGFKLDGLEKDDDAFATTAGAVAVGFPVAGIGIRVCKPGTRQLCQHGEMGELHIWSTRTTISNGYLPPADPKGFYIEGEKGWFNSEDQACIDEKGRLYVFGRYKDLIIRGAEKISPAWIEDCLHTLGSFRCAAIGVPDPIAGELPLAVIEWQQGKPKMTKDEIMTFAQKRLGPTVAPSRVLDIQEDLKLEGFPATAIGKIQKNQLKTIVVEFLRQDPSEKNTGAHTSDVLVRIRQIWTAVTNVTLEDKADELPMKLLADSINIMRFLSASRKQTGIKLSLEDIKSGEKSLKDCAALIQTLLSKKEAGMPYSTDHLNGSANGTVSNGSEKEEIPDPFAPTGDAVVAMDASLKSHGLDASSDVQTYLPVKDFQSLQTRPYRPASWNHRFAFCAPTTSVLQLRQALKAVLTKHDGLRTWSVTFSSGNLDNLVAQAIIATGERYWRQVIPLHQEVPTKADFVSYAWNEKHYQLRSAPGPMLVTEVVRIRSTPECSGLIIHGNHSAYDALEINLFISDLVQMLLHPTIPSQERVPFTHFLQNHHHYRFSTAASKDCEFHAKRLADISFDSPGLWPPQKSPLWFQDTDKGWHHTTGQLGHPWERKPIDSPVDKPTAGGQTATRGALGISRTKEFKHLPEVMGQWGIPANVVFKSAVALLNIIFTRHDKALFANFEAGRSWPLPDGPWAAEEDIMDVTGCTYEFSINRIPLSQGRETAREFLHRVHQEQSELSAHCHAPFFQIQNFLRSGVYGSMAPGDATIGASDAVIAYNILKRQGFNWRPALPDRLGGDKGVLTPISWHEEAEDTFRIWDDCGLIWHFQDQGENRIKLVIHYDDCQLSSTEVEDVADKVMKIADWLQEPRNAEENVRDFVADILNGTSTAWTATFGHR